MTSPVLKCIRRVPLRSCHALAARSYATVAAPNDPIDIRPKKSGTIMDVFASSQAGNEEPLPLRFSEVKKTICKDQEAMVHSWRSVLQQLECMAEEIAEKGSGIIPCVPYSDISRGLVSEQLEAVKKAGVVVVRGAVSQEVSLVFGLHPSTPLIVFHHLSSMSTGSPCLEAVYQRLYSGQPRQSHRSEDRLPYKRCPIVSTPV